MKCPKCGKELVSRTEFIPVDAYTCEYIRGWSSGKAYKQWGKAKEKAGAQKPDIRYGGKYIFLPINWCFKCGTVVMPPLTKYRFEYAGKTKRL